MTEKRLRPNRPTAAVIEITETVPLEGEAQTDGGNEQSLHPANTLPPYYFEPSEVAELRPMPPTFQHLPPYYLVELPEYDDTQVINLSPKIGEELPDPKLDLMTLRNRWKANLKEDLSPEVADVFVGLTRDYIIEKELDELSLPPGPVHEFTHNLEGAIIGLMEALGIAAKPKEKAKAEKDKAAMDGKADEAEPVQLNPAEIISSHLPGVRFFAHDFAEAAPRLLAEVSALRRRITNPEQGKASAAQQQKQRQLAFVGKLLGLFEERGWPAQKSKNGLLAQCFLICIKAAGEGLTHRDRLIDEAMKLRN